MKHLGIYFFTVIIILQSLSICLCAQWEKVSGSYGGLTASLLINDTTLFAGTTNGVFISTDNGNSWTSANNGFPPGCEVVSFTVKKGEVSKIFASTTNHGVFVTTDQGISWSEASNGLEERKISCLAANTTYLFAGTDHNVFRSADDGNFWEEIGSDSIDSQIVTITANDTLLFASCPRAVFRSTDNGDHWEHADGGLDIQELPPIYATLHSIVIRDSIIYGGSELVMWTTNRGNNWYGKSSFPLQNRGEVNSIIFLDTYMIACDGIDIFRSPDNGNSWATVSNGLPKNAYYTTTIFSVRAQGTELFAATIAGVFHSVDFGLHWQAVNNGLNVSPVRTLCVRDNTIFSDAGNGYFLKRSTDKGSSWTLLNDTTYYHFVNLASNGNYLAATTDGPDLLYNQSPLLLSADMGTNWLVLERSAANALAINDTFVFTGARYGWSGTKRFLLDNGSWMLIENGLPELPHIQTMTVYDTILYAGTVNNGIYYSINNGDEWIDLNNNLDTDRAYSAIACNQSSIFAATFATVDNIEPVEPAGIFRSLNNGETWNKVNSGLSDTSITALAIHDSIVFAVSDSSGIFVSVNNGNSWQPFNSGLPDSIVYCIGLNEDYIYAGVYGGIWRRSLIDVPTGINPRYKLIPDHFSLKQNYPNPFNNETVIIYRLPVKCEIKLFIYNIIGQKIVTLVSEIQNPGYYKVKWDGSQFASGLYFYRIITDNGFSDTKKFILLK